MDTVFVLLKRKPGLSFDEFRTHYETSHAKLGEKYFGHLFHAYRRHYIPSGMRLSDGAEVDNAYDCLTELVFREPGGYAELKRIASDPEIRRPLPLRTSWFQSAGGIWLAPPNRMAGTAPLRSLRPSAP